MLGPGFRRGGSILFNNSRVNMSRRMLNQQRRALAMGTCLAHNVSLANIAPNAIGSNVCKSLIVNISGDKSEVISYNLSLQLYYSIMTIQRNNL